MELSLAQLQTLKTFILANYPTFNDQEIADALNTTASPDYWVLRTSVGKHEITDRANTHTDGSPTNFVWGGSTGGFIARSQGEQNAWKELFNTVLSVNTSLANVRTAFDDIFSGAGAGAVANRNHIKACSRRLCTVVERQLVVPTVGGPTQTGSRGATTNPDTMGAEGPISIDEVVSALNS